MKPEQLGFDLGHRPALGREDFVVSEANAEAVTMIETEPTWPAGKLVLTGPESCGKSHLVQVWVARSDAIVVPAESLDRLDIPTLARGRRIAVEDASVVAGRRRAETALFHLHNLVQAEGGRILITSREAPSRWGITLPDLSSRLNAARLVRIAPPDDSLLTALVTKQCADRQIDLPPRVAAYLVAHMTRSAATAARIAAELNRLSLARRQPVTIPLARTALDRLSGALSSDRHPSDAKDQP